MQHRFNLCIKTKQDVRPRTLKQDSDITMDGAYNLLSEFLIEVKLAEEQGKISQIATGSAGHKRSLLPMMNMSKLVKEWFTNARARWQNSIVHSFRAYSEFCPLFVVSWSLGPPKKGTTSGLFSGGQSISRVIGCQGEKAWLVPKHFFPGFKTISERWSLSELKCPCHFLCMQTRGGSRRSETRTCNQGRLDQLSPFRPEMYVWQDGKEWPRTHMH